MDRLCDGYLVRTSESLYSVQSMANIRIRLIFDSSNTLVNRLGPNKRVVNIIIMKVYIERNNLQLELIRYRKNVDFIHV